MTGAASEPAWTPLERALIRSMSLDALPRLPAAPSNAVADSPAAARLGKRLFFDEALSPSGTVSCATCHQPERLFTDGRPTGQGVGTVARNTPTLYGLAWYDWYYWDGRKDSLWSQALAPFEAADEMGASRVHVLRTVFADPRHRAAYTRAFGERPPALPGKSDAHPYGEREARNRWERLPGELKSTINRAFANVGKALGAWQRTLGVPRSPFDDYADGDGDAISADAKAGLRLFMDDERTRCMRCHLGPRLTNGDFHNIGTGNYTLGHLDFGRAVGLQAVRMDEFNCLGPYSDAAPEQCSSLRFLSADGHHGISGAFRTPTLRGLRFTAPYFHDGSKATLRDVLEHYRNPSEEADELQPLLLEAHELDQLEAFLLTLSPETPPVVP